jgi:hypothetical protein
MRESAYRGEHSGNVSRELKQERSIGALMRLRAK